MAHQENHHAGPSEYQPLVRTGHDMPPGAVPGHELMQAGPFPGPVFARTPRVVNGSMDAKWFLHSLRRRWLLATMMGLLLGAAAAAGLYYAFPESLTAVARFKVKSEQAVMVTRIPEAVGSYEIFRETQMSAVKQPSLLSFVKDDATLRDVAVIRDAPDPIAWLEENINVAFDGKSEYMRISLNDNQSSEDLKKIVDAVSTAYRDEVVNKEKASRRIVQDGLKQQLFYVQDKIHEKYHRYRTKMGEEGHFEGEDDPLVRLLTARIALLQNRKIQLENNFRAIREQLLFNDIMRKSTAYIDARVSQALMNDLDAMAIENDIYNKRSQLRRAKQQAKGRETRQTQQLVKDLQELQQQKQAIAQQIRQQVMADDGSNPSLDQASFEMQARITLNSIAGQVKEIDEKSLPEAFQELRDRSQMSTELMILKTELDQLEAVAADMQARIASWDIELEAPDRVVLAHTAVVTPGINAAQRYTIAGLGGVATMLLAGFGIAYMEFLGRRLNGPDQVDEGLGIRVVGTLPSLDARKMTNVRNVAQLSESIDNVRTALMHDSTSKPRQVVLVTSPCAMEGRTIVASQLAASLARAGRRTLLVDGDMRRPALHTLFGVPLEDGLCEVLRAEADVTDVVRPTQAEGLWLMTAGYCDADAVHAMATDQIQPIFEKLRAEYDFVIIDGAPVLGLSDSLMIGQHCDGVLLSVLRDQTSVPKIYQSTELLRSVGIRMIGAVVNGVSSSSDRRVTHLQVTAPKSSRKQLESATADK